MCARFRRTSGFARGNSTRKTSWSPGPSGSIQLTSVSVGLFPVAVTADINDATILRTRGDLNLGLSIATTALDGFGEVAVGICVVSDNAAGIGVTAVPDPLTDIDWEGWLMYWTGSVFSVVATAALSNCAGVANVRVPIDSKAMRKIQEKDTVVGVIAVGTEVGAVSLTAKLNTRILSKLT